MLLYIHVPFCRRKCRYCAFFSGTHTPELERAYLDALKKEALIRGGQFRGRRVSSIYLGGGTPTLLSLSALSEITDLAAAAFSLDPALEFTIEANPETIPDKNRARALMGIGVNRMSLGVQTLEDDILFKLGRGHSAQQALQAAGFVRESGMDSLGLDLIWGLPGQTLQSWLRDLRVLMKYRPEHISCYNLTLEPGTPLAREAAAGKVPLPRDDIQALMYREGGAYLESKGLLRYEVSNFARRGHFCRHNSGYWEGKDYIGLGPSAVSTADGRRWMNPRGVEEYSSLGHSSFEGLEAEEIKGASLVRERVMLALRTAGGLSLRLYHDLTGKDFLREFGFLVKALEEKKLARVENGFFCLTGSGMLVSNSIIERFIT